MRTLLVNLGLIVLALGCVRAPSTRPIANVGASAAPRRAVVFVHGANLTASSWREVQDLLAVQGVASTAVELPGRAGVPPTNAKEVTLELAAARLCGHLSAQAESLVVAHSQGGAVVHQALATCPERIGDIVYVAAVVPFPGEKPFDRLSQADGDHYFEGVRHDEKTGELVIAHFDRFAARFAPDATSRALRDRLKAYAVSEPAALGDLPLRFPLETLKAKRRHYVHTRRDEIVGLDTQRSYVERLPMHSVRELDTGHLPMVTAPQVLSSALFSILQQAR